MPPDPSNGRQLDAARAAATRGRIGLLTSFSGAGGVEKMLINLIHGFLAQGFEVDLLLTRARGPYVGQIPAGARQIRLTNRVPFAALSRLASYLRRTPLQGLLAAKDRPGRLALWARKLSRAQVPIALRIGTTPSGALAHKGALLRAARFLPMRWVYPWADALVAVSEGVAEDLARITRIPASHICVVRNPVITPELERRAGEALAHPWLASDSPLVLGVGRLTLQKDFATLLRAFAKVQTHLPSRLLILGEGRLRPKLVRLAADLGLSERVQFPGFQRNPYAYLARADLFVLSSRWEGSPNVLTEAMALGTPVVATDCPSGPRELLQGGRHGRLVAVGDVDGLADAITATLLHPPPRRTLQAAVASYAQERSVAGYLSALGIEGSQTC